MSRRPEQISVSERWSQKGERMSAAQAAFAEWTIAGMHCPSCAATIERNLKQVAGVTACEVNFGAGRVGVGYDPQQVTLPQLEAALQRLGHPAERRQEEHEHSSRIS